MNRRQVLISIEVLVAVAVLAGVGAFLYFVQPSISLEGLPFLGGAEFPRPTPSTIPTPTPDYSDLLTKPADKVGIVSKVEDNTILLKDRNGEEFNLTLDSTTTLYQVLTDVVADPPTMRALSVNDLVVGDAVSVYWDEEQNLRAVFVVKK